MKKGLGLFMVLALFITMCAPVQVTASVPVVTDLSAGAYCAFALKSDGTVWAWGDNNDGALGIGAPNGYSIAPTQVKDSAGTGFLTGITAISSGSTSGYALKLDGTVWAWGYNYHGQLGNGLNTLSNIPVQVKDPTGTGFLSDVIAIDSGYSQNAMALKSDGTVWAWGFNENGQLGNGTKNNIGSNLPVQVILPPGVKIIAIACGGFTNYALDSNNEVWAWGANGSGQIGDGSKVEKLVPVKVTGLAGNTIISIAGGTSTGYALDSEKNVWAWGSNNDGQLGNGTYTDSNIPVKVSNLTGVTDLESFGYTAYAIKDDKTVWSWGLNEDYQLGVKDAIYNTNTAVQVDDPSDPGGPLTDIKEIAAGFNNGFALESDGTVWGWGDNTYRQLGCDWDVTIISRVPIKVPGFEPAQIIIPEISSFILDKTIISTYGEIVTATVMGKNLVGAALQVSLDGGTTKIGSVSNQTATGANITFDVPGNASEVADKNYTVMLTLNGSATSYNCIISVGCRGIIPASNLIAADQDNIHFGVDGRDFHASWVPSSTASVTEQAIYILPAGTVLDTVIHTPSAAFADNTTTEWTGPRDLITDSAGNSLTAGNYMLYIVSIGPKSTRTNTSITVSAEGITTSSLPSGRVNLSYSYTLNASGGVLPYKWTSAGLPGGLSMSAEGVLSGTPAASGTYTVVITVVDSNGSGQSKAYTLVINPAQNNNTDTHTGPAEPVIKVITEKSGQSVTNKTIISPNTNHGTSSVDITLAIVNALISKAKLTDGTGKDDFIEISVDTTIKTKQIEVNIPHTLLAKIVSNTDSSFSITSPLISITFDDKALEAILEADSKGTIVITANILDKVKGRPVYDFGIMNDDKNISDFKGGHATITIPYTLQSGENPNSVVICSLADDGNLKVVRGRYYADEKAVIFKTGYISKFIIGYNHVSFSDIAADAWYKDAVDFIAALGITSGTGSNRYSPESKLTRAQFVVFLMNAYQISTQNNGKWSKTENFSDAGNTYYTDYLLAARGLGIVKGIGNNLFAPEQDITRQEMFVILYNVLKAINELPEETINKQLKDFNDADQVATYAREALNTLIKGGIVTGSNKMINPSAVSTRAQMAQILYNLMQ